VVSDQWQHRGIAHRLMEQRTDTARSRSLERMEGEVLSSNHEMLKLAAKLNFTITTDADDAGIRHIRKSI
jgi:acetyltransferase